MPSSRTHKSCRDPSTTLMPFDSTKVASSVLLFTLPTSIEDISSADISNSSPDGVMNFINLFSIASGEYLICTVYFSFFSSTALVIESGLAVANLVDDHDKPLYK